MKAFCQGIEIPEGPIGSDQTSSLFGEQQRGRESNTGSSSGNEGGTAGKASRLGRRAHRMAPEALRRRLGSRVSRSQSPTALKDRTSPAIATPGKTVSHHAESIT